MERGKRLVTWWPVIGGLFFAATAIGAAGLTLRHNEERDMRQEDRIISLEKDVAVLKNDVPEIKRDVKELLRRVR